MPRKPNAEPTPEEIAERCREIQAEWTTSQREQRASGYAPQQWTLQENVTIQKG